MIKALEVSSLVDRLNKRNFVKDNLLCCHFVKINVSKQSFGTKNEKISVDRNDQVYNACSAEIGHLSICFVRRHQAFDIILLKINHDFIGSIRGEGNACLQFFD